MKDPRCTFCDSLAIEKVAQWGGQIITAQWRCGDCGSYFEVLRDDFDDPQPLIARDPERVERDEGHSD